MIIRKVETTDNTSLAKMIREVFLEFDAPKEGTVYSDPTTDDLFDLFRQEKSILWVAELDGKAIGCCGVYPTPGLPEKCTELVKFYLAKEVRGCGIGKRLLGKSIESAKELGYEEIYLESLPVFSKAINIYEKQGFYALNKPMGQSGHPGCNVWMLKKF